MGGVLGPSVVKTLEKPRGLNLIQTTFVTFCRIGLDIYGSEDGASLLIRLTGSLSKLPSQRRAGWGGVGGGGFGEGGEPGRV